MESWRYLSGEKGFLSEDINTPSDSLATSKQSLFAWESRNLCNFSSNLFSTQQQIPSQGFEGFSSLDMAGKQVLDSSALEALSSKAATGKIPNPVSFFSNQFHGDESISRLSGSIGESNSRDSSLIDLKLGRFADNWDTQCYKFSKGNQIYSSSKSPTPLKRIRGSLVNLQTAFCQVYGCNKDLSSSKDYHKRHRVCEVHSKTARVIVNGIEKRFCQQCSRFHLLAEFDDGKRSCRKRLASHNERRRKPQVGTNSGRSGRLLSSYNANQWTRPIKVEGKNEDHHRLFSTFPVIDGFLQSKSFFPHCDIETQFRPFAHDGTIFNETGSHYSLPMGGLISSSQSLFNGSEDFRVFDEASTVPSLSRISDPGCALSLLSAQSRNSSDHSSEALPFLVPIDQTHYHMNQLSEKLIGVSSQASTSGVSNKIPLSAEGCQMDPILTSDSSDTVNFKIFDRNFQGSSESRPTINLLPLSSQLQRVEHQWKSGKRCSLLSSNHLNLSDSAFKNRNLR